MVWAKGTAEPIYIVCTNEEVQARRESWIREIRGYVEYRQSPMEFLARAVSDRGGASGRVGIEKHFLQAHFYEELRERLPRARLEEAGALFDAVRAIKTPAEIQQLETAALATDQAIHTAFQTARPGTSEKQIGAALTVALLMNGADAQVFQALAAGPNMPSTHHVAGGYVLRSGDLLRTDFGGVFRGYNSDLARTVCVGEASQRQRDTYRLIWDEHERLIALMRPGVTGRELFESHRRAWEAHGWPLLRPHIGHSLGIGIHEHPLLRPGDDTPLQPGMVLCMEPAQTIADTERYHVEDTILITESEPRVLSRSADWSSLTPE